MQQYLLNINPVCRGPTSCDSANTLKFSAVFGTTSAFSSMTTRPRGVASPYLPNWRSKKTRGFSCEQHIGLSEISAGVH